MIHLKRIYPALLVLALAALACNMPVVNRGNGETSITAAAQTVQVQLTGSAVAAALTPVADAVTPTGSQTLQSIATQRPPTHTPVPPAPVSRCNWAEFVADVTIPDGTRLVTGAPFTKVWRIKNVGTCTWTTDYKIGFGSGSAMGGAASLPMPEEVRPGDTIDIEVDLVAPPTAGRYTGYWKLYNPAGVAFGVGNDAQGTFYVQIEVNSLTPTATGTPTITPTPTRTPLGGVASFYDFTVNVCKAEWRSGAGVLPCPGVETDNKGSVMTIANPKLQDGVAKTLPGIWTHPEWRADGVITGKFPAYTVQKTDHFRAVIGCKEGGLQCNVRFQLNYKTSTSDLQNLGQWDILYETEPKAIDIPLIALNGSAVEFVFTVIANGAAEQDWAIWWQPRITK